MILKKSQKNLFYDMIEKSNLSPSNFEYLEERAVLSEFYTVIKYKQEDYHFTFYKNSISYCPTPFEYSTSIKLEFDVYFEESKINFSNWLSALNEEISLVDKWLLLHEQQQEINFFVGKENKKFSDFELHQINNKVDLLQSKLIKELALNNDVKQSLSLLMDHQKEMAKKLSKVDWANLLIGSLISFFNGVILNHTMENIDFKLLWQIVKSTFSGLLISP